MMIKRLVLGGGILLGLLVCLYGGLSAYAHQRITAIAHHCERHSNESTYTPATFLREGFDTTPYLMPTYEEVSFPSRESDLTISGWFIPNQKGEPDQIYPTVIIVHGFNDCKNRPFSLTPAGMLTHHGYNALAIDLRNHGDSSIEDGRMAAGTEEYLDVLGAWDWLIAEKGVPAEQIGLYGYSMGGATVMIAAAKEPQIAAVWEDSSFADFEANLDFVASQQGMPIFIVPGVLAIQSLTSDENLDAITPLEAVKELAPRPLQIVHGVKDKTVDPESAFELADAYKAAGGADPLWLLPTTKHIEAIFDDTELYQLKLLAFFGNAICPSPDKPDPEWAEGC